jgi:hypothetical protein
MARAIGAKKKVAQLEELDYPSIDRSGEKQINAQKKTSWCCRACSASPDVGHF